MSGDTIFSTTGKPIVAASFAASAADVATPSFGTAIPYASHTIFPSGAVSAVRASAFTVSRTRLTSVRSLIVVFPAPFDAFSDDFFGAQRGNLIAAVAEFRENLFGVL